jgi:hypothetical protein
VAELDEVLSRSPKLSGPKAQPPVTASVGGVLLAWDFSPIHAWPLHYLSDLLLEGNHEACARSNSTALPPASTICRKSLRHSRLIWHMVNWPSTSDLDRIGLRALVIRQALGTSRWCLYSTHDLPAMAVILAAQKVSQL